MHKLIKKITKAILLTTLATLLVAAPVLAAYYAPIQVSMTASYNMLPIIVDIDNSNLVFWNYITNTALDTRVQEAGVNRPHMVAGEEILFAAALSAGAPGSGTANFNYVTGDTSLTDFNILTGYGGYITIDDAAALELGSNFEIETSGYVDTSSGANKNIVYKEDAFRTYVSAASEITSAIIGSPVADSYDTNDDNNSIIYGTANWAGQTFLTTSAYSIDGVYLKMYKAAGSVQDIVVSIRATSGGLPTGSDLTSGTIDSSLLTTDTNGAWYFINLTDYSLSNATTYAIVVRKAASEANDAYWRTDASTPTYANGSRVTSADSGSSWAADTTRDMMFRTTSVTSVTATGVASGEHIIETTGGAEPVLSFDGTNDTLTHATLWDTIPTAFTIITWFYLEPGAAAGYLVGKRNTATELFTLRQRGVGNELSFDTRGNGQGTIYLNSVATLSAETWYMATAVYEVGVASRLYLNTTEATAGSVADQIQNGTDNDFTIGARDDNYNPHDGLISLVHIYNRALSAAEITNNYNNGWIGDPSPDSSTGLIGWWQLDEGSGGTTADSSGQGNTLTINGATWDTVDALVIFVDSVVEDSILLSGASVPNNANDWTINQNDVMPYMDYYEHTVSSTLIVDYEPVTRIITTSQSNRTATSGTVNTIVDGGATGFADDYWNNALLTITDTTDDLAPEGEAVYVIDFVDATETYTVSPAFTVAPESGDIFKVSFGTLLDKEGTAQNGRISWGVNPSDISYTVGGLISTDVTAAVTTAESEDVMPTGYSAVLWGMSAPTNAYSGIVNSLAAGANVPAVVMWVAIAMFFVILVMGLLYWIFKSIAIAGLVGAGLIITFSVMGILPQWAILLSILIILLPEFTRKEA